MNVLTRPLIALDEMDRMILRVVQAEPTLSVADIAAKVNLSANPVWRRIKRLEEEGVIVGRYALLDRAKLGLGVTVFVSVKAGEHSDKWLKAFSQGIAQIPEVVEFYRMSGEIDYLLKILVPDIAGYDEVYKRLIKAAPLADVSASFAMEEIKRTLALPI